MNRRESLMSLIGLALIPKINCRKSKNRLQKMRVLINERYGGFGLSDKAIKLCIERGMTVTKYNKGVYVDPNANFVEHDLIAADSSSPEQCYKYGLLNKLSQNKYKDIRTNPTVHEVVEELGIENASGRLCSLKFVEIPFNSLDGWHVMEDHGKEWIGEDHKKWS